MLDNAASDNNAVLQTLTRKPWEVDGSVDAYRRECCGGIYAFLELSLVEDTKLKVQLVST